MFTVSINYMFAITMCSEEYFIYQGIAVLQACWQGHLFRCKAIIRNLVFKFMNRFGKSNNCLVEAMLGTDIRWISRINREWVKSLKAHNDL